MEMSVITRKTPIHVGLLTFLRSIKNCVYTVTDRYSYLTPIH